MSETSTGVKAICKCPHCGKRVAVGAAYLGRSAACPGCQQKFTLTVEDSAPRVETRAEPSAVGAMVCAVCQSPVNDGEPAVSCPACSAVYHSDCWEYNTGCAVYGCSQAPPTENLNTLEIPASYWGQEDKACPSCGKTILAAAVRCKHCGATFASTRPQDAGEYQTSTGIDAKLPRLRKITIWLLVFSVLPCTSPIAAVFGWIWWASNAAGVRKLPALNRALCKIALGVSTLQTAILVLAGVAHSIFG